MALCALSRQDRLMFGFRSLDSFLEIRVTGKTERSLFVHNHSLCVAGVGVMACETFPLRKRAMVRAARFRLHQIAVTLGAHFGAAPPQQILLIRSVGAMAGITSPVQNGLMRIGLQELSLGTRMAGIANPVHSVLENILNIRAVGIVARVAFLLGKRCMGNLGLLSFFRLCVAGEAQFAALQIKKIFVLRGVGGVARKASLLTDHRGVIERDPLAFLFVAVEAESIDRLEDKLRVLRRMGLMAGVAHSFFKGGVVHRPSALQLGRVMTIVAKLASCLGGRKGLRIRRRFMTGIALGRDNRIVGARFQELCLQGGMGIVAARTRRLAHGIVAMRLFEGCFGAVMAAKAEGRLSLHQEVFLVRTVSEMARGATLWPDLMNDLFSKALFFVTLETSFIPFRLQQVAELGSVGVMALNAFPPGQGRMHAGFIHPYLLFAVAGIADFISFLFQDQFGYETVAEMTILAFFLLDGGMDIFHYQIFVGKFFVAVETALADKPSSSRRRPSQRPFLWRFGAGVQKDRSCEKKDSQNNGFMI